MDKPQGSLEAEARLEDHMEYLISIPALEEGINNLFLTSHQIRGSYSSEREECEGPDTGTKNRPQEDN